MGKNKTDLKQKLIGLVETRLELLGFSEEDIIDMQLESLSVAELVLTSVGAYRELYTSEPIANSDNEEVVEYEINDNDIKLIQSIQLFEVQRNDMYGNKYNQLSLVEF